MLNIIIIKFVNFKPSIFFLQGSVKCEPKKVEKLAYTVDFYLEISLQNTLISVGST